MSWNKRLLKVEVFFCKKISWQILIFCPFKVLFIVKMIGMIERGLTKKST